LLCMFSLVLYVLSCSVCSLFHWRLAIMLWYLQAVLTHA
jgi:hypothetical protein